jgi:hemerythrin-like domain-containing protein
MPMTLPKTSGPGDNGNMDLFDQLGAEHARIAAVCDAFDAFAAEVAASGVADLHEAIRFVTFFRGYADGLHHEREEVVLFQCLSLAGFPLDQGPLAHLRDQHVQQRGMLLDLEKALSAKAPWGLAERSRLHGAATTLTAFERAHMAKEREMLLPVAQKELVPFAGALATSMDRFERKRAPRWDRPWLELLASELTAAHPSAVARPGPT